LLAQVQAAGLTLEDYLQQLVEKELSAEAIEAGPPEGRGIVWENGLLVYRTGRPLPAFWAISLEAVLRQLGSRTGFLRRPSVSPIHGQSISWS
jgi:hypothetical protein